MGNTGISVDMLKAQLLAVETAITNILTTGQSYVRPGLSLTRADLDKLTQREKLLSAWITRAQDGIFAVGEVAGTVYPYPGEDAFDNDEAGP